MKHTEIASIQTACEIYWGYPEIGTKEIMTLFNCCRGTAHKKKYDVINFLRQEGIPTNTATINTDLAYKFWGLDIKDFMERVKNLKKIRKAAK